MLTPERMELIHVVFSSKDINRVADAVVHQGSIQVLDISDMETWTRELTVAGTVEDSSGLRIWQKKLERLIGLSGLKNEFSDIKPDERAWAELESKISEMEQTLQADLSQLGGIEEEVSRLKEVRSKLGSTSLLELPVENREELSYLTIETVYIKEENIDNLRQSLKPLIHVISLFGHEKGRREILIMVLRRDRERLQSILAGVGFESMVLEDRSKVSSMELLKKTDQAIGKYRKKKEDINSKIKREAQEWVPFLQSAYLRVRRDIVKKEIINKFRKTERTYLLSGLIPGEKRENFIKEMRRVTKNRCIVELVPAEDLPRVRKGKIQVPVKLRNPPIFKPFEILTKTYGIPEYRSIDPTPVLGLSFLIMFGVMFGDIGHGLILMLCGGFMVFRVRRESLRNAGLLILYAGVSSAVFGFLFGSFFGVEELIPAIWLKPMDSISRLFKTAIFFGIAMISLAVGLNIINGIRKRDFLGIIFDKAGLLAVALYWCGIIVASRMLTAGGGVGNGLPVIIPGVMVGSVVLLFFREPIVQLFKGKRKLFPEGIVTGVMGSIVELLEIFLGFLSNTVSFIRVAAFGLAHAGLFMAVFALSDSVKTTANGMVSILVLIFGNILIICLEGLIVSIQAVRLEFYEFFSRFFQQGGRQYLPVEAEFRS